MAFSLAHPRWRLKPALSKNANASGPQPGPQRGRDELLVEHAHLQATIAALSARIVALEEIQRDVDRRIVQACEDERRRIARELHDSTAQRIFTVNLNLINLKGMLTSADRRVQSLIADTLALGQECLQELRSISYLLRPPLLEGHEFVPALCSYIDGFCKRSGLRINLVIPAHATRMPSRVENALFRVLQEALSNIHRHSGSESATVTLRKSAESVVLEVRDQGKGIAHQSGVQWRAGGGLAGIQERVREIGGRLEVKSASPGILVVATVPLGEASGRQEVAA